jgi:hypothetical protein
MVSGLITSISRSIFARSPRIAPLHSSFRLGSGWVGNRRSPLAQWRIHVSTVNNAELCGYVAPCVSVGRWRVGPHENDARISHMPLILILVILLLVFGGGGYYMGPGVGYYGGGGLSLVLLIVILFLLFGRGRTRL